MRSICKKRCKIRSILRFFLSTPVGAPREKNLPVTATNPDLVWARRVAHSAEDNTG